MRPNCALATALVLAVALTPSLDEAQSEQEEGMRQPLMVHPTNPRYFTDGTGRAVYLTGSHTWNNLQHNAVYPPVEFDEYLDFLHTLNHNYTRMWAWEQGGWDPWAKEYVAVEPVPYARTGPGEALDGRPKYDLAKFDEEYFSRLRARVAAAQARGIYVSVMLFQGWSVERKGQVGNPWQGHPLNQRNNINAIAGDLDGDGQGTEIHTLGVPKKITRLQEAYVKRVVDTVNEFDNVLYEIGNELHPGSVEWQYHMIRLIHEYESSKPKQHLVGMTGAPVTNDTLFGSPADWISPEGSDGYRADPPPADGAKVIIADVDHIWPSEFRQWVWKSFTRGLNTAFMDLYGATKIGDTDLSGSEWVRQHDAVRRNLGYTLSYAHRVNLAAMVPRGDLTSTGYCLACPGQEYIVYQPAAGPFTVEVGGDPDVGFAVEWLDPVSGEASTGRPVAGGAKATFEPPYAGDAVLYLRAQ